MIELMNTYSQNAVIKVIGVGGCGGNAVANMLASGIEGVEFIVANTDAQVLRDCQAKTVLQLGGDMTRGLGAGANPEVGRLAAEEDRDRIEEVIQGTDMLFIAAGMGGGTGTGAAPVIARIARDLGILTVAVVTKPFSFEGKRKKLAEDGITELIKYVDSLITIPNEKLLAVLGRNVTVKDAFKAANNVLYGAVQGIAEVITKEGMINADFADVKTVMTEQGMAMMGSGSAHGDNRAREAAEKAISSPFLEDINVQDATGVLVNVTAGHDMTLGELDEIGKVIGEFATKDALIIMGAVYDDDSDGELRVTVIATGLGGSNKRKSEQPQQPQQPQQQQQQQQETVHVPLGHPQPASDEHLGVKLGTYAKPTAERPSVGLGTMQTGRGYEGFETPTIGRRNEDKAKETCKGFSRGAADVDYLDVPAFLRRQAD